MRPLGCVGSLVSRVDGWVTEGGVFVVGLVHL